MRRNMLLDAQPYPVEQALQKLGRNLRTARLRRDLTIHEAAEKIGTGKRLQERVQPATSDGGDDR